MARLWYNNPERMDQPLHPPVESLLGFYIHSVSTNATKKQTKKRPSAQSEKEPAYHVYALSLLAGDEEENFTFAIWDLKKPAYPSPEKHRCPPTQIDEGKRGKQRPTMAETQENHTVVDEYGIGKLFEYTGGTHKYHGYVGYVVGYTRKKDKSEWRYVDYHRKNENGGVGVLKFAKVKAKISSLSIVEEIPTNTNSRTTDTPGEVVVDSSTMAGSTVVTDEESATSTIAQLDGVIQQMTDSLFTISEHLEDIRRGADADTQVRLNNVLGLLEKAVHDANATVSVEETD